MGWESPSPPPASRSKAGPASFNVRDVNGSVEFLSGPPPSYNNYNSNLRDDTHEQAARAYQGSAAMGRRDAESRWNPRHWRKRTWAIVVAVIVVIIVVASVAGALVAKANRYPNYSKLSYSLKDTYSGTSFFDKFDYYTGFDPAQGFVHYVPKEQAQQLNLTYAGSNSAYLRVDTSVGPGSQPDASTGRFSVRVSSKTQYNSGLFIFDVKHTPYGCGTWPALWFTDQYDWPNNGEIDLMESVNQATTGNQMTLHSSDGCDMGVKRIMSGSSLQNDCHNSTNSNAGCGVEGPSSSYGEAYNSAGGGIAAMEWRAEGIRMWQFARSGIPADITAKTPDPSSWGSPAADFPSTECSISSHFRNQSIVANIDLCGQFAGGVYPQSGCPGTCTDYVAQNPSAFINAFWEFGAFEVYQAS